MRTPKQYQPYVTVKATRLLTVIVVFMALGTAAELVLLEHYEDKWQIVPIALTGVSIIVFILSGLTSSKLFLSVFKGLMVACAFSGVLGIWFHLKANFEFEKELHPAESGWPLFVESLSGALPVLAPGSLIAFSLIGYLYTLLIIKKPK